MVCWRIEVPFWYCVAHGWRVGHAAKLARYPCVAVAVFQWAAFLFFAIWRTQAVCLQVCHVGRRSRPYRNERTGSLPNSEVKRCRAQLVLRWGTAREAFGVLRAFSFIIFKTEGAVS